jgi:hypothetical protein
MFKRPKVLFHFWIWFYITFIHRWNFKIISVTHWKYFHFKSMVLEHQWCKFFLNCICQEKKLVDETIFYHNIYIVGVCYKEEKNSICLTSCTIIVHAIGNIFIHAIFGCCSFERWVPSQSFFLHHIATKYQQL